jgi:2-dehydro-3-deoxygalactonokinase
MSKLPDHFISCDWGTSNFRLRLVETHSLQVLAEHRTDQGIRVMHQKFQQQAARDRLSFYTHYLKQQLPALSLTDFSGPIVISGMASSNLGLEELPYAHMPFLQTGAGLEWRSIVTQNGLNLLLISGVKSENGMMRGEETQAIGLAPHLSPLDRGILILPGTHSKHLVFEEGKFTGMKNFMTGEVFEVMSLHSILSNSVSSSPWSSDRETVFVEGLEKGLEGCLTSSLFSIRADHVLKKTTKEDNYFRLSGMVIGDELACLKGHRGMVVMAAPDPMFTFYRTALNRILLPEQLVLLDQIDLAQALLIGQKKILELDGK